MNADRTLTITSLLAVGLTTIHLSDDVMRGFEPGGAENLRGMAILAVWLYATLMLRGRRSGYLLLILGALLATVIPVVHMTGRGVGGEIAASSGAHFFIWTLFALGATGPVSLILAVRGLWRTWRGPAVAHAVTADQRR
jgi:hypothetical protein